MPVFPHRFGARPIRVWLCLLCVPLICPAQTTGISPMTYQELRATPVAKYEPGIVDNFRALVTLDRTVLIHEASLDSNHTYELRYSVARFPITPPINTGALDMGDGKYDVTFWFRREIPSLSSKTTAVFDGKADTVTLRASGEDIDRITGLLNDSASIRQIEAGH